jgi:hypothetical protein
MSNHGFLAGPANMDRVSIVGTQNNAWHDAVATCILRLPRPSFGTIYPEVLPLRILPLSNGGFGIHVGIGPFSPRYKLFIQLGVMPPNPVPIAKKILTVLGPRSVAARVAHARFFFDHQREPGMPPAMRLRSKARPLKATNFI